MTTTNQTNRRMPPLVLERHNENFNLGKSWLIGDQTAVLDKQETPTGPEHSTHVAERLRGIGNAAQGPSRYDGVGARILEGNAFGRTFDQFHRPRVGAAGSTRHSQELWRRIKSDHLTRVRRIKWQVEPGARDHRRPKRHGCDRQQGSSAASKH
jgi:hypothetical protein